MFSTLSTDRILNIAHRGARSLAPENTLAAARKALQAGADMWELDVQMTADGELVVIHDTTLNRTSNVRDIFPRRRPWRVHEFTLDEIRQLDFGSWFAEQDPFGQIAAGVVTKTDLVNYSQEPAPTLQEALYFTREHEWLVNIEIKDLTGKPGTGHIVNRVTAVVEQLGMADMVLFSSFNHDFLVQIRALCPHAAIGVLVSKPHPRPAALLQRLGAQSYHPRTIFIRPADIKRLIRQGYWVNVRTINDRKTMQRLVKGGVSGIFTDFPQVLSLVLASYREDKA